MNQGHLDNHRSRQYHFWHKQLWQFIFFVFKLYQIASNDKQANDNQLLRERERKTPLKIEKYVSNFI